MIVDLKRCFREYCLLLNTKAVAGYTTGSSFLRRLYNDTALFKITQKFTQNSLYLDGTMTSLERANYQSFSFDPIFLKLLSVDLTHLWTTCNNIYYM